MTAVDPNRLRDDLTGVFEGDLLLDDLSCALYATDASPFELKPVGVARPRHEADVQALVRFAGEHGVPLTARGAGTGLAGACLGPGLIVDFSRYMHAVLALDDGAIRVQPGATWGEVDRLLAPRGRRLAIEPAHTVTSTIGGLLASAAGGPRLARLGPPHEHLLACRAVLDASDAVEFSSGPHRPDVAPTDRLGRLHRAALELLQRSAVAIAAERPATPFDRCAYRIDAPIDGGINYPRLLTGSEGTLALFTELTVRTLPRPGGRCACLFGLVDLDVALRVALDLLPRDPSACVVLDRRLLSLLRARSEPYAQFVPAETGAALVVEFEGATQAEARRQAADALDAVTRSGRPVAVALPGLTEAAAARLWNVVDAVAPTLADLRGGPPATPGLDDLGAPPERLGELVRRIHEILQQHDTTAALLIHVTTGHIDARPFLNVAEPTDAARLYSIAEAVAAAAWSLGGSIGVCHGTGLGRTPWVAKQFPRLAPVFRELKTIFDPRHLFNPGNIVGPDPSRPAWPMRAAATAAPPTSDERGLLWRSGEFAAQVSACNGCGSCRADGAPERMCPVFRAGRAEEAAPRAKANLLRELLRSGGDPRRLSAEDVRAVANLCVNCKMCALECPAHVNIPKLMIEAKAANVAEHGLDRADWVMARLGTFSALGSTASLLSNRLLRGPLMRWFLEKFFGLSRRRRMPPFARRSFLRQARRWNWTTKPGVSVNGAPESRAERVALFVDIFANYHDPTIAEAAVRVLKHNGVTVFVPPAQTSCGMEALAQGDVETARELAHRNRRVFAELAREGFTIVCSEPTAALALTRDYLDLIDDPEIRLMAGRTVELSAYLAQRRAIGALRTDCRPLPITIAHHVPCHLKALGGSPAAPALLRLIPEAKIVEIDAGCSGMAGTFGLRAEHYETSLAAGRELFAALRRPRIQFGATECSSCRLQMEEGAGKPTLHPVQYLALAYGLMPELAKKLTAPVGGLVAP